MNFTIFLEAHINSYDFSNVRCMEKYFTQYSQLKFLREFRILHPRTGLRHVQKIFPGKMETSKTMVMAVAKTTSSEL